jgi:uncharacterized protein (DUF1501 family)
MPTRRDILKGIAGSALALTIFPRFGFAAGASSPRLLVVMLRGGLDGLHALPPLGDSAFAALRGGMPFAAAGVAGSSQPIPLDTRFGLHPSLVYASELYKQRELLPVVAIAPPYQGRSHFEAQDCVENGSARPNGANDGWMNRCVAGMRGEEGLAISTSMPLIMRGPGKVSSWSPPLPQGVDPALLQRLDTLYAEDPQLAEAYQRAIAEAGMDMGDATTQMSADAADSMNTTNNAGRGKGQGKGYAAGAALPALMKAAGKFLVRDDGPQLGFVEDTGWDTHAAETATLQRKLQQLDGGLRGFREAMGSAWSRTVVVVVTEFGRTAKPNGTGGTDHGTGGAAFLAGGAIAGGRIAGQWPGLSAQDLNEGRDLHATTDMRALFKGVLAGHMHVPQALLDTKVFPDSAAIRPMPGLLRVGASA